MKPILIEFQLTKKECLKAMRKYLAVNKTNGKSNLIIAPFCFAVAIWFCFDIKNTFDLVLSLLCIVACLINLGCGLILYFYIPNKTYKILNKNKDWKCKFTRKKIIFITDSEEFGYDLNIYEEIWKYKDYYFLHKKNKMFFIIPKRAFTTKEQRKEFEKLMREVYKKIKNV